MFGTRENIKTNLRAHGENLFRSEVLFVIPPNGDSDQPFLKPEQLDSLALGFL